MFTKKLKTIIKVEGMHCEHCAKKVCDSLEKLENVSKVTVDLEQKQVTVLSKKSIEEKKIKEAIENLDYKYIGILDE